jgi:hypothetical protein
MRRTGGNFRLPGAKNNKGKSSKETFKARVSMPAFRFAEGISHTIQVI